MTFEEWYRAVNTIVENNAGMSCMDLPDYCYRDEYDDGRTPLQTARAAIRNAKGDE